MVEEYLMALPTGSRLSQYEIIRVLGAGGFGVTYLARDTSLDKLVAIKEYMPSDIAMRADGSRVTAKSTSSTNDFQWGLTRFLDEARILAKFRHPNIVEIHQVFEANQTAYIVMEYAEGETLSQHLDRVSTLNEAGIAVVLLPVLEGLKKVHEMGFLHRDIKPGNIILRAGTGPVLIDFGAARQAVEAKSRSLTSVVTEGYAPIEQYASNGHQGTWTDIYALGAVAYKCLTSQTPPAATQRIRTDPIQPAARVAAGRASPHFLAAVDWALSPNEADRPQTIGDWLPALQGSVDVEKTMRARAVDATMRSAEASHALTRMPLALQPTPIPAPYAGEVTTLAQPHVPTRIFGFAVKSIWPVIGATAAAVLLLGALSWWLIEGRIPQDDRLAWAAATNTNTVDAYQAYLRVRPAGYYVSDARERIEQATAAADEAAWTQAAAKNTVAGYEDYIRDYPAGRHLTEARSGEISAAHSETVARAEQGLIMAKYYSGRADGRESAEVTAAVRAYQHAKGLAETGTIDNALIASLDQTNAEQLRAQREAEERESRAYSNALSHRNRRIYEAFLRAFAASPHAGDVRARLSSCRITLHTENVASTTALTAKGTGRGLGNEGCRIAQQQAQQQLSSQCTGHLMGVAVLSEDHDTAASETGSTILNTIIGAVTRNKSNVSLPSNCTTEMRGECEISHPEQRQSEVCG